MRAQVGEALPVRVHGGSSARRGELEQAEVKGVEPNDLVFILRGFSPPKSEIDYSVVGFWPSPD